MSDTKEPSIIVKLKGLKENHLKKVGKKTGPKPEKKEKVLKLKLSPEALKASRLANLKKANEVRKLKKQELLKIENKPKPKPRTPKQPKVEVAESQVDILEK